MRLASDFVSSLQTDVPLAPADCPFCWSTAATCSIAAGARAVPPSLGRAILPIDGDVIRRWSGLSLGLEEDRRAMCQYVMNGFWITVSFETGSPPDHHKQYDCSLLSRKGSGSRNRLVCLCQVRLPKIGGIPIAQSQCQFCFYIGMLQQQAQSVSRQHVS